MELIKKSWLILGETDKKNLIKLIFFNFIVIIFELLTLSILVQALNIFTDTSVDSKLFF